MQYSRSNVAEKACLLQIGLEVVPVYGDDAKGWSVESGDLGCRLPSCFRYRTLDELFFALVNMNLSSEGQA
jgi:hypothetical protein